MTENTQSRKAYDYVLERIKTNKWKPGERIYTEKELCERLDVSRVAVRAALDQLTGLGVLEKRRGAGTFVCEIDLEKIISSIVSLMTLKPIDILDVLRFRLYFESGNITEFMKFYDPKSVAELRECYEQMELHKFDHEEFYLADLRFHSIIARGTKNQIVISIHEMLMEVLKTSLFQTYTLIGPETGLKNHRDLLEAIERKDAEMASLLAVRYIEENIKLLYKIVGT